MKRIVSILIVILLICTLCTPAFAVTGEGYFTFREWDGEEVIEFDDVPLSDFEPTEITESTSVLNSGWYVVKGENIVISGSFGSLTVNGGTVEATANTFGTGIGGGVGRAGGTVDIHGGIVEASFERGGAAFGGSGGCDYCKEEKEGRLLHI